MPPPPQPSPDLVAFLGQFGLAVLKRLSSPLRALAWLKVGLFGAFNFGLLALKATGSASAISVEISEASLAQVAISAAIVVLMLLVNLIAFFRQTRVRAAAQSRMLDLLADPNVSDDIKRELLSRLD